LAQALAALGRALGAGRGAMSNGGGTPRCSGCKVLCCGTKPARLVDSRHPDESDYLPVPKSVEEFGELDSGGSPTSMSMPRSRRLPQERTVGMEIEGFLGIMFQWLNLLLIFVPLGIVSHFSKWSSAAIFCCNFAAIVPLAGILGAATESLAVHTGQMVGGLLNATFGNAVEMIVTIQAINKGLISVVQGSLLGSILSNLLLVLGMAFFAGGLTRKEQKFSAAGAGATMMCLVLGSIALALPTIYNCVPGTSEHDVLEISRVSSVIIAIVYILFLIFQLGTHAHLFSAGDEEEDEEAPLSIVSSLALLFGCTLCVSYCSEFLVDSIEDVSEEYGLPKAFIGVILLPIVGNAAEHVTAVTVAMRGKMDLTIGVAVGSSTQIVLFVIPFAVIVGWVCDQPMTLDFRVFDASVLILSCFIAVIVLQDGSSNWLEGCMLMATYLLVAVISWYVPDGE